VTDPITERHSEALTPELITDPTAKAEREARNGLQQFDTAIKLIEEWTSGARPFRLRPSLVLQLHRVALDGLSAYAGNWRPAGVRIEGRAHEPVGAHLVPERIESMCDYVNDHWGDRTAIHLAAYLLWRLNWIHPFDDGNGRTARAVSYVVLCIRLGYKVPGTRTIPDQISENKQPYYLALEAADKADRTGSVDVSQLEEYVKSLLAEQLLSVVRDASGSS
jgi:Fic family protein